MRIQKNNSKSVNSSSQSNKYDKALSHIKAAIDELGKDAKTDIIAKENIANLSVVLFDLKSKN